MVATQAVSFDAVPLETTLPFREPASGSERRLTQRAYDGSQITLRALQACGWDVLLNYGYHTLVDWFVYPFDLSIPQTRLAQYTVDRLQPAGEGQILDVACGRGKTSYMLSVQYPRAGVVGIDLLREHVQIARGIYGSPRNLHFQVASAEALPFDSGSFDGIHCLEAAFHFDRAKFLRECARVLRPGGRLVLVDFMWKDEADRRLMRTPAGEVVRETWQMDDLSSEREYLQLAAQAGLSVASRVDLTNKATRPALRRFQLMSAVGSKRWGRRLLGFLHQNLRQFSEEDWKEIRASVAAHAQISSRTRYVCLILEKGVPADAA